MVSSHTRRLPLCLSLAFTFIALPATAKTVVCIAGDNDQFTNSAEGYFRQLRPSPPAIFSVGGDSTALINCMAQVGSGDSLVIVAHGGPGYFQWGGRYYAGFSGGRAATGTGVVTFGSTRVYPIQLPANFIAGGLDITVCMVSCFSETAPQGAKSTVQSMQDAIKAESTVKGFAGQARVPTPFPVLTGGTAAQRNAAYTCLVSAAPNPGGGVTAQGRVRLWLASFRPPGSGVSPNSQSKAEETINATNCPAAGGAVQVLVDYSRPPFNQAPGMFPVLSPLDYDDEPIEDVSVAACELGPTPVQKSTWGAIKALHR